MSLNVSWAGFLTTAAYIVLFGFFWRSLSIRYHDTTTGKAMGFIF